MNTKLIIRQLGVQPYEKIWHKMQDFTDNRTEATQDEIWIEAGRLPITELVSR